MSDEETTCDICGDKLNNEDFAPDTGFCDECFDLAVEIGLALIYVIQKVREVPKKKVRRAWTKQGFLAFANRLVRTEESVNGMSSGALCGLSGSPARVAEQPANRGSGLVKMADLNIAITEGFVGP